MTAAPIRGEMPTLRSPSQGKARARGKCQYGRADDGGRGPEGRLDSGPMVPYKDENPTYLTPVVTLGIIAANVLAWVVVQGLGAEQALAKSVCELGLTPGELLRTARPGTVTPLGEHLECVITNEPHYWTILTSMFMHGGWLHLLGNMWFLWVFGNNIEDAMGHGRFVVFYLLCGVCAAGLQMLVQPRSTVPMVGASGAISGVMGAWILLQFLGGPPQMAGLESGGVAFFAHIGGFAAGLLLIRAFAREEYLLRRPTLPVHYHYR